MKKKDIMEEFAKVVDAALVACACIILAMNAGCGTKKPVDPNAPQVSTLQKIETGIQTFISDVKAIDSAGAKVSPAIVAISEALAPGSATTVALEKANTIVTKSAGAIQSFTLTFPPQPSGTLSIVKASADVAAQLAPQVQKIADATAPGSSATKAIDKASIQVGTVNGIIQNLTITVPDATPATPATGN